MSYTKGPWKIMRSPVTGWHDIFQSGGSSVASVSGSHPDCEDNARAIAALPALLEAAQQVIGIGIDGQRDRDAALRALEAAVEQALGETP